MEHNNDPFIFHKQNHKKIKGDLNRVIIESVLSLNTNLFQQTMPTVMVVIQMTIARAMISAMITSVNTYTTKQ